MAKSCSTCRNRYQQECVGVVMCPGWERADTEEDCVSIATSCKRYVQEESEEDVLLMYANEEDIEEYTPSATHGDYSPLCPWNAPGMSISDFI